MCMCVRVRVFTIRRSCLLECTALCVCVCVCLVPVRSVGGTQHLMCVCVLLISPRRSCWRNTLRWSGAGGHPPYTHTHTRAHIPHTTTHNHTQCHTHTRTHTHTRNDTQLHTHSSIHTHNDTQLHTRHTRASTQAQRQCGNKRTMARTYTLHTHTHYDPQAQRQCG